MQRYFNKFFCACLLFSTVFSHAENLPGVVVTTVKKSDISPVFNVAGRIEATERIELLPRVSGYIEERLFEEGGIVEKDQLLFRIEKAPYKIQLQQAQADLAGAQAGLKNAEAELKRAKQLRKSAAVSKADLELAEAKRDQSKAQVMQAKAGLDNANLNLSYTDIKSPIHGRISKANFSVGNLISPSTTTLATVLTTDPVYVELHISEKVLLDARRNGLTGKQPKVQPTLLLSDSSKYPESGTFVFISPEVDRNTDTIMIRVSFPNTQGLLLPGEFVQVQISHSEQAESIAIPQSAVQKDKDNYYVLVLDKENTVEVRPVILGLQQDGLWEVKTGLVLGERIIIEGLQKVRPGAKVNPVNQSTSSNNS